MTFLKSTWFKVGVSGILLVALGWFVVSQKGLSKEELALALGRFDSRAIGFGIFFVVLQNVFMALRIWGLFPDGHRVKLGSVIHGVFYGQTLNTFVPARAGDILKAVIFTKAPSTGQAVPVMSAAGVIVADKLIDIVSLVLIILLTRAYRFSDVTWLPNLSIGNLLIATAILVTFGLILRSFFLSKWEQVVHSFHNFRKGLSGVLDFKKVLFSTLMGLSAWGCEALTLQFLCKYQEFTVSFPQAVFILFVLNLMIAVPISFANLGPFEAAIVFALGKLGAPTVISVAVAAAHHALQMVALLCLTGIVALFRLLKKTKPSEIEMDEFRVDFRDKQKAIEYFEKVSADYDETVSKGILKIPRDRERAAVLSFADLNQTGASLLDVGCGAGFYSLTAKKAGMKVHSVDLSPGMVKKLEGLVDKAEVVDIELLPTDKKYDRVVCAGVLDFVLKPELAFSNLCKVVAPGGRLVVLCPRKGPGGLFYRLEKFFFGIKINLYTKEWLSQLAEKHGLKLVKSSHPLPTNMALLFKNK